MLLNEPQKQTNVNQGYAAQLQRQALQIKKPVALTAEQKRPFEDRLAALVRGAG
jgi:hypothetical protein